MLCAARRTQAVYGEAPTAVNPPKIISSTISGDGAENRLTVRTCSASAEAWRIFSDDVSRLGASERISIPETVGALRKRVHCARLPGSIARNFATYKA